ncbi:hypothetical protein GCM10010095_00670 [Streptomyces anthocyanicus]|nr:hypothetical protein GCM10010095_00670 [Streptomyces anthocyanicus]
MRGAGGGPRGSAGRLQGRSRDGRRAAAGQRPLPPGPSLPVARPGLASPSPGPGGGPSHCPVGRPGRWVARRATEVFRSAPVVGGASAGPRALLLGIRTDSAPADWDPAATLPDHPVRPPGSVLS